MIETVAGPAQSPRSLVPSFLIPSPALTSCQSPQIQPHHPAGAAADLHVCSSPDPICIGIERPKLPHFRLEIDTLLDAAPEKPPVVEALRAPAPAQPRTVEAAPSVGLASTVWPGPRVALPAPEWTQPATPTIAALAQPMSLAATEPRPTATQTAADGPVSTVWRDRALSLPPAEAWLAANAGASQSPAIASRTTALPITAAQERSLEGNPQPSLESAAWPVKPLALPRAVDEEMFPPELAEAPVVRAGERPLPLVEAAVREGAATPVASLALAQWTPVVTALPLPAASLGASLEPADVELLTLAEATVRDAAATPVASLALTGSSRTALPLPLPGASLGAALGSAGAAVTLDMRAAEPKPTAPAAVQPIDAFLALAAPALSLEAIEPEGAAIIPAAAAASFLQAGAQAPAVESAPESDLRENPWSVSESVFPFEPSLEFVGEGSALSGASAIAELASNPAAGRPAISANAQPLTAAAASLQLGPLALEPEPPAYLSAEPPVCEAPLPFAAPAPAANEPRLVSAAEPARSIAKPQAPAVVPSRPAPHGQEEFQAAAANPAAESGAVAAQHPDDILPGASLVARMPLRPHVEAIDPDSTSPAGFILLDYHCHGVQAAPVPSFTWRWRIAPTQLPEFKLRTVPVKLEELLDDKKDVIRPFFQAAKSAVPKPSKLSHPVELIAAALLLATLVGMGGRAAFHSLRGDSDGQTASAVTREIAPSPTPQIVQQPARTAANSKPPGVIARVRQAIAERASLELNDTFQTGMQSWGQAKALAPGWVKSADGYVRPGQLALYQPHPFAQQLRHGVPRPD